MLNMDIDAEAAKLPHKFTLKQRFTIREKLQILDVWDRAGEIGMKSALLRRLGLEMRIVNKWNQARREGKYDNRPVTPEDLADEIARLQKHNAKLQAQLDRSESAVEALGKASELLTALAKSSQREPAPAPPALLMPPKRPRPAKRSSSTSSRP